MKYFIAYGAYGAVTRFQVCSRKDCLQILKDYPEYVKGSYVNEKLVFTDGLDFIRTYETIEKFSRVELIETLLSTELETLLNLYHVAYNIYMPHTETGYSLYTSYLLNIVLDNISMKNIMAFIID